MLDLTPTTDPSLYDLCPHHAEALVVPKGWELVNDRTAQEVMVEPSADDRWEEAARRRRTATAADVEPAVRSRTLVGAGAGRNRYAALVEQLPRLAAEAGVPGAVAPGPTTIRSGPTPSQPVTASPPPAASDASDEPPLPPTGSPPAPPAFAQEPPIPAPAEPERPVMQHARSAPPMPSRELAPSPPGEPAYSEPPADPPLPGQLRMPVDDPSETSGVVLPFELAGPRRRNPRT